MRIKVASETKRIDSFRDQLDDDIDVLCEPQISVGAYRQSSSHEIADARGFKRGGKRFKAGEFHNGSVRSFPSYQLVTAGYLENATR
jgi:hypothetical protein